MVLDLEVFATASKIFEEKRVFGLIYYRDFSCST